MPSIFISQISKPSLKPVSVEKQECYAASIFSSKFHFFLQEDERIIAQTFGQMDAIDVTASSVEFDLSALIGRMVGSQRCKTMYSRCTDNIEEIMAGIRKIALKKD